MARGPQKNEEQEAESEELLVKAAIDRATAERNQDEVLVTQLCKICTGIDKAKKRAKTEKTKKTKREGQIADPRVPYDVLVQEGISPNLGPRATQNKNKRRNGSMVCDQTYGHGIDLADWRTLVGALCCQLPKPPGW